MRRGEKDICCTGKKYKLEKNVPLENLLRESETEGEHERKKDEKGHSGNDVKRSIMQIIPENRRPKAGERLQMQKEGYLDEDP